METEPGVPFLRGYSGFFYALRTKTTILEDAMQEKKKIISYRRCCNLIGQGTGLSHYILLTPQAEKSGKDAGK